jgi:arylsulfatase A-like enzyme
MVRGLGAGFAGGMLAGAAIGATEAVVSWIGAHGAGEMPAVAWAMLVYGMIGAGIGLGIGVLCALVRSDAFGLALGGVLGILGVLVGRFRVIRDVFQEQAPRGFNAAVVQALVLLGAIAAAAVLYRWLRGADARRGLATRPIPVFAAVATLAAILHGALRPADGPRLTAIASRAAPPSGAPNIILLMCDTLRADHLSSYGYAKNRTPRIDGLAAEGIRFANNFAQASWTRASVGTILTGLYPSSHGAVHKSDMLPDRVVTLAEMLTAGGYYAAGLANNANVAPNFNFGQGFDDYRYLAPDFFFGADEPASQLTFYNGLRLVRERFFARRVDVHNYYQPGEVVTAQAIRWLSAAAPKDRPFFLFLHYMDPHDPFMVHPFNGEGYARVANPNPPADQADKLRQVYDGEISYLDTQLGALFDDLKSRGQWDNTVVLLTADHGEEFHEHGGWWHGTTLYDEQIHVPLIVKPARGGVTGRVVTELTTNLDIAPTLLTAARLPVAPTLQGHPLPLTDATYAGWPQVFSENDLEGNVLTALRSKDWKLIRANADNPRGLRPKELYDLAGDPTEQRNVAATAGPELQTLEAALTQATTVARRDATAGGDAAVIDTATCQRLCALGYVSCDTCGKR